MGELLRPRHRTRQQSVNAASATPPPPLPHSIAVHHTHTEPDGVCNTLCRCAHHNRPAKLASCGRRVLGRPIDDASGFSSRARARSAVGLRVDPDRSDRRCERRQKEIFGAAGVGEVSPKRASTLPAISMSAGRRSERTRERSYFKYIPSCLGSCQLSSYRYTYRLRTTDLQLLRRLGVLGPRRYAVLDVVSSCPVINVAAVARAVRLAISI